MKDGYTLSKTRAAVVLLLKGRFDYLVYKSSPWLFRKALGHFGYGADERFSRMQKTFYEGLGTLSPDSVVGNFAEHEKFPYEEYLLRNLSGQALHTKVALDFGCGMGRMIRRMSAFFLRVDGVDIANSNIRAAKQYTASLPEKPLFYVNNGRDLSDIESGSYHFLYSTIAMQHIPVHAIRLKMFAEFRRLLADEGSIAVQMAYSASSEKVRERQKASRAIFGDVEFSEWEDDAFDARSTNGSHDVLITDRSLPLVKSDLTAIGFSAVDFAFSAPPNESVYDKWIYIYARK